MGSGAEPLFVQAVKADLHEEAKLDSPTLVSLKRGNEVESLERQSMWVKVKYANKVGWISRLFLSTTRPVGEADLSNDIAGNLEKASRRRSSSYAVSASSRGLMTDERTRQGRALYRTDSESLDALESTSFEAAKLRGFQTEAKLGD